MRHSAWMFAGALVAAQLAASGCGPGEAQSSLPARPQIIPYFNPINLCETHVPPNGLAGQSSYDLQLFNRGRGQLRITSFEVTHDRRCAFTDTDTSHYGDVLLYDNDSSDDFLATVESLGAAHLRIRYSPPDVGEDEVTIRVHSNAENFPDLDLYVCGAGTSNDVLSCRIRIDPECSDDEAAAATPAGGCDARNPAVREWNEWRSENQCPMECGLSGAECRLPSALEPEGLPCPEGEACTAPYYCVADAPFPDFNPYEPSLPGTCMCRPCATPPDEGWDDCPGP